MKLNEARARDVMKDSFNNTDSVGVRPGKRRNAGPRYIYVGPPVSDSSVNDRAVAYQYA